MGEGHKGPSPVTREIRAGSSCVLCGIMPSPPSAPVSGFGLKLAWPAGCSWVRPATLLGRNTSARAVT